MLSVKSNKAEVLQPFWGDWKVGLEFRMILMQADKKVQCATYPSLAHGVSIFDAVGTRERPLQASLQQVHQRIEAVATGREGNQKHVDTGTEKP